MVLAWFPITSSWNTACYIRGLIHGIGRGVPNAARFVVGDYRFTSSPSQMMEDLGWHSLQSRRNNVKLVMMYRITYGLVDIPAACFLHPATLNTRGHCLRYLLRTVVYSFFPSGICLWNSLLEVLVRGKLPATELYRLFLTFYPLLTFKYRVLRGP